MRKKLQNWKKDELDFIKKNYNKMTASELSEKLNKTRNSVYNAIRELGLKKQIHNPWTSDENKYLIEHYLETSEEISMVLNRTVASINTQRDRLGLVKSATWTDEDVEYLKRNYMSKSYKEIANKLNRSEGAIIAKCNKLGLVKKDEWTDEDVEFLSQNYYELSISELSKILNRTPNSVKLKANKIGLKKSPYYCNYNFFDKIDTEEKAYWLGFLTADGWISKNEKNNSGVVGIELQYGDIDHLKKFNKSLNGNYKITDRWRKCRLSTNKQKANHQCVIRIFSLYMYNALVKLGFTNNKSYDVDIPSCIQHNLIRHYLRGVFDGDGCFSYTSKSFNISFISASKNLMSSINEIIDELNIEASLSNYISEFNTPMYELHVYKKADKLKLLNYMYKDSNIYLTRKHEKYVKATNDNKTSVPRQLEIIGILNNSAEEIGEAGTPIRVEGLF